jgi:hypothetical protein
MGCAGSLALISIVLSLLTESTNFFYFEKQENNLFVINAYELLSLPITVSIIMTFGVLKRTQNAFIIGVFSLIWMLRLIVLIYNNFITIPVYISYATSLLVCTYCGLMIYKALNSDEEFVEHQRSNLFILLGIFIFEATSIIPCFSFLPVFKNAEIKIIGKFYFFTLLFGTLSKNILFTIFFFREKRKNNATFH